MAAHLGWPPSGLRAASLAELWVAWIAHARAQGWLTDRVRPMSRARLRELMEQHPDG